MSTKLYDFYKINENHQIVFDKINKLRRELNQHVGLNYQILFASYLTELVDDTFKKQYIIPNTNLTKPFDFEHVLTDLLDEYYEKNKTQQFGLFDIFENSLVVYSYKNEVYIKTFFNTEFAARLFFSLFDKYEDFHYQNSTDRPDNINEVEWDIRKSLVEDLFSNGKYSDNGLVADFRPELWEVKYKFHKKTEILKQIPNKKYRADTISKQEIENEFFKMSKDRTVFEFNEFKKTSDYSTILEEKQIHHINNLTEIKEDSFKVKYKDNNDN